MKKYTKEDVYQVTWEELDKLVSNLVAEMSEDNLRIHVISPILRSGGVLATMLANKLNVVPMLPVQFKYSYQPLQLHQVSSLPDLLVDLPGHVNILLCEGNLSAGTTATAAAELLREKYPYAKIYLAALTKVYGCPEKLEGIEKVFYGQLTDESFVATLEEKESMRIRSGMTVFPWEDASAELADINSI